MKAAVASRLLYPDSSRISHHRPHAVFFNNGTGRQFTPITFGDKQGAAYGFALGDIHGDRFPDIGLARSGAPNVLYLSEK
jgi:hypothetical protein